MVGGETLTITLTTGIKETEHNRTETKSVLLI